MTVLAATRLDQRVNAYRDDIAAAHLQGRVDARSFVQGAQRQVSVPYATMRASPDESARTTTQLLFGERVTVYDEAAGWAWLQNEADDYVGYVPSAALGDSGPQATHRVSALRSFVFPEPDLKTPPLMALSFWSPVAVEAEEKGWCRLGAGGWIYERHLCRDRPEPDYAATALRFLGVPYLWGGRTSLGLDCSALVQLSLAAAGIACPRDSDMQRDAVGQPAPNDGPYRRGDLIFFAGHVGVMVDGASMVHANAFHMAVALEPLANAAARVPIAAVRRLC